MSAEEFSKSVRNIVSNFEGDPEACHARLDALMEDLLVDLGYYDGVGLIRASTRWCA